MRNPSALGTLAEPPVIRAPIHGRKPRRNGRPGGRQPRTAIPDNLAQEQRQTRCFELSLAGMSATAIANLLGHTRSTVLRDLAFETRRRAEERGDDRVVAVERSLSRYEKWIGDTALRVQHLRGLAQAATSDSVRAQYYSIIRAESSGLLQAQRQQEAVQGLTQPFKIDASNNINVNVTMNTALDAFGAVPPEQRAQMRAAARAHRAAEAALVNITPSK